MRHAPIANDNLGSGFAGLMDVACRKMLDHTCGAKGKWQMPEVASFSGQYDDYDPFVTTDGGKLFFSSDRPAPGKDKRDFDIWYVEKTVSGWSEPRNVGPPVNSPANEFYPSVARDGTLYFGSSRSLLKNGPARRLE